MIDITVKYFAALAEHAHTTKETMTIDNPSIESLYTQLKNKYKFPYEFSEIKTAINTSYVDNNTVIQPHDTVVFITPVAGG